MKLIARQSLLFGENEVKISPKGQSEELPIKSEKFEVLRFCGKICAV